MRFYRTFIEGFDEALDGGIPEGHVVLLSGPPGTMKSSIAYNILWRNALDEGLRGVYVTLEQGKPSLEFQMSRMGLDPAKAAEGVRIQDLSRIRRGVEEMRGTARPTPPSEKPWLDVLKNHLEDIRAATPFDLLVLDSLPVLEIIAGLRDRRITLFHFFAWLRSLNATSFIVSETVPDLSSVKDEDFLADGVIHLTMERVGDIDVYRRIRCLKMRGVDHSANIFTLEFKDGKFRATQVI
ncbi:MAG TPA: ATPase domain-containing protein [Thermoplasmata archaeon]|jgi:KaiC/GvpD/RAD55 family RecA-like ATPase|nr:ATPase domain-containing protein [Thermoplasmata archaeon]